MKCFNFDGETYIDFDVNSFRDIEWRVPFDWMAVRSSHQIKQKAVDDLFALIERVENIKIGAATRESLLKIYLSEVYLKDEFDQNKTAPVKKSALLHDAGHKLEDDCLQQQAELKRLF